MRRLAYFLVMLLLGACNLNPISEIPETAITTVPTRTLTLQDAESSEESSTLGVTVSPASLNNVESTEASCSPPDDWYIYTVQRGDNLTRIADISNSTVDELIAANCLDNPNRIRVGMDIFVPSEPE